MLDELPLDDALVELDADELSAGGGPGGGGGGPKACDALEEPLASVCVAEAKSLRKVDRSVSSVVSASLPVDEVVDDEVEVDVEADVELAEVDDDADSSVDRSEASDLEIGFRSSLSTLVEIG